MKSKIQLKILALAVPILLILIANACSRADGFSQVAPVEPMEPGDPPTSEPMILTDKQGKYPLGLHLELLEDPSGELTIEDVSSPAFDSRFIPSQVATPNYGYTDSAYWVRLRIDNQTLQKNTWLLELGFPNMYYVDLYSPLPNKEGFAVKQSGALRDPETRDIRYPRIIFSLDIPSRSLQTFYLRFQNGASMTLPLTLWDHSAFLNHSLPREFLLALFYGALIGLLIYNVFLLLSLREASYLYLVIFLTSLILYLASYDGYAEIYLFRNLFYLKPYYHQLFYLAIFIPMILYTDSILELKSRHSTLHKIMLGLLSLGIILLLLILFESGNLLGNFRRIWSIIASVTFLVAGIIIRKQGYTLHRYDIIALFVLLISLILINLTRAGLVPSTFFSENAFRVGLLGIAMFWSIAQADRIDLMKTETENANRDLRNSEYRLSQILEGMPLGVVVYGKDQKLQYLNKRTVEILGNPSTCIQPDIAAGRSLAQAVDYFSFKIAGTGKSYPIENLPVYSALHGEPASVDDIEVDQGDKQLPLEVWASPVRDDAGNVQSAVAAFQNITQRKQAEAELSKYQKHLEALVEERTAEANATNKELRLRLEWLAAVNLVNQIVARSADFGQIYEKIVEIINQLFTTQDSFIAELVEHRKQLKILSHSCRSHLHPDLVGSFMTLPDRILSHSNLEGGKPVFISRAQAIPMTGLMSGPFSSHIQASQVKSIAFVPLQLREQVLGYLGLELSEEERIITSEESNLLGIFSIDIAQLIEDARLFEQAKKVLTAEERNRLARELHDSVAQTLYSISLFTDATRMALDANKLGVVKEHLEQLVDLSKEAMSDMRLLIFELRPPILEKDGLVAALQNRLEAVETRAGFQTHFETKGEFQLKPQLESELYRIAQEALNNVIKHAHADQVKVQLKREGSCIRLIIEDNGVGFDPDVEPLKGGQGLRNIQERAKGIGAVCWIESAPGQGTKITIEVNK